MVSQFIDLESDNFYVRLPSNKIPEIGFHRQAVKTVAYLRVPTAQQDAGSQRLAILEYARKHDFRVDYFIEATASGRGSETRRRLDELMTVLQSGDRLVVSELSRLGRSLGQIVAILDALAKEGVSFLAIKENIRVEGKQDIQTKVMTTLFALFAEVERDLISERTREGLAKARSSGKKLGRPKGSLGVSRLDGKEDEISQRGDLLIEHVERVPIVFARPHHGVDGAAEQPYQPSGLRLAGRPRAVLAVPRPAKANHPKLPAGTRQEPDGLAGTKLSVGCGGRRSVLARAILTATLGRRPGHSPEWPTRRF